MWVRALKKKRLFLGKLSCSNESLFNQWNRIKAE